MRIPKTVSVCLSICPYPEKRNYPGFVNINPTIVIDTSMERSSREQLTYSLTLLIVLIVATSLPHWKKYLGHIDSISESNLKTSHIDSVFIGWLTLKGDLPKLTHFSWQWLSFQEMTQFVKIWLNFFKKWLNFFQKWFNLKKIWLSNYSKLFGCGKL